MARRLNGPEDSVGGVEPVTAPLLLETHFRGGALVVRPVGELTPKTYEQLRDYLLKCAAEEPEAIVVDLASLRTTMASLLTVFPTVRDRTRNWPGVPFALAAAQQPLRTLLDVSAVRWCVPTYHSVNGALDALDATTRPHRRQVQLPCDAASARLARQLVELTCHQWEIPATAVAAAAVVASELTDNMVHHARSDGWLRLELRNDRLTVAVADADPRPPQLRVPNLHAPGGRGLVLINKLSHAWGTASRLPAGKVVWAILTVPAR